MHEVMHFIRKASTTKTQREHSRGRALGDKLIARSRGALTIDGWVCRLWVLLRAFYMPCRGYWGRRLGLSMGESTSLHWWFMGERQSGCMG